MGKNGTGGGSPVTGSPGPGAGKTTQSTSTNKVNKTGRPDGQTTPLTAPSKTIEASRGYPTRTSTNGSDRSNRQVPVINERDREFATDYGPNSDASGFGATVTNNGNAMSAPDRTSTIKRVDPPDGTGNARYSKFGPPPKSGGTGYND